MKSRYHVLWSIGCAVVVLVVDRWVESSLIEARHCEINWLSSAIAEEPAYPFLFSPQTAQGSRERSVMISMPAAGQVQVEYQTNVLAEQWMPLTSFWVEADADIPVVDTNGFDHAIFYRFRH
jgi:hypothetical protein